MLGNEIPRCKLIKKKSQMKFKINFFDELILFSFKLMLDFSFHNLQILNVNVTWQSIR